MAKAPAKETKERKKYVRPERKQYPIPKDKLKEVPANYDPKVHAPLKRGDFENEALFFDMKADEYDRKATRCRVEAGTYRKLGSKEDRAKAKRLLKMRERYSELEAQLRGQGVDVDAILSIEK